MKTQIWVLLISLVAILGTWYNPGMGQAADPTDVSVSVALLDADSTYLLNEDIQIVMSLENTGALEVITSEGFSAKDFHLELHFTYIRDDGTEELYTAIVEEDIVEPLPPKPVLKEGEFVQVETIERLPAGWVLTLDPFIAQQFYNIARAGKWRVEAVVGLRTYSPGDVESPVGQPEYVPLGAAVAAGDTRSGPVEFSVLTDADSDNYYYPEAYGANAEADCDDANAQVNPGAVETMGNGIDDDCNPQTPDTYEIADGIIRVLVEEHTVGKKKKSQKKPIKDLWVRAYDKAQGSCLKENYGVSPANYEPVWWSCTAAAQQQTDKDGIVKLSVEPGQYVVIGEYPADELLPREEREYIGVSVGKVKSGKTKKKYLQVIVK
jgi:hypothetical protein